MRLSIASSVVILLVAVSAASAEDASGTATITIRGFKTLHPSAEVRSFSRWSADSFARLLQSGPVGQDRRSWFGGLDPCTSAEHDTRLTDLRYWREEGRIRVGYDGSRYDLPALKWTQSGFFQPQMMVQNRHFYDPTVRRYTVDRYLDDLDKRYGGI